MVSILLIGAGEEEERRTALMQKMFRKIDPANPPFIEAPFTCDYVSWTSDPPVVRSLARAITIDIATSLHMPRWPQDVPNTLNRLV